MIFLEMGHSSTIPTPWLQLLVSYQQRLIPVGMLQGKLVGWRFSF